MYIAASLTDPIQTIIEVGPNYFTSFLITITTQFTTHTHTNIQYQQ